MNKEFNMAQAMKIQNKIYDIRRAIRHYDTPDAPQWQQDEVGKLKEGLEAYTAERDAKLAKLQTELDEVQKRSRVRTITTIGIINALVSIEDKLDIPRKSMEGIRVRIDYNEQDFPKAYKYTPESTWFSAEFRKGSWRITNIWRDVTAGSGKGRNVSLTDEAKAKILAQYVCF